MIKGWAAFTDGIEESIIEGSRCAYFNKSVLPKELPTWTGGPSHLHTLSAIARASGLKIRIMHAPVNGIISMDFMSMNYVLPYDLGHPIELSSDIQILWTGYHRSSLSGTQSPDHFVPVLKKHQPEIIDITMTKDQKLNSLIAGRKSTIKDLFRRMEDEKMKNKHVENKPTTSKKPPEVVNNLVENGANIATSSTVSQNMEGHSKVAKKSLVNGTHDVNVNPNLDLASSSDLDSNTGLQYAKFDGHPEVVNDLVENGANIATSSTVSQNMEGHSKVAKNSLGNGAHDVIVNPNLDLATSDDFDSNTGLESAKFDGHPEVVKNVVENGAESSIGFNARFAEFKEALDIQIPIPENDDEIYLRGDVSASNNPCTSSEQNKAKSLIRQEIEKDEIADVSFQGGQFRSVLQSFDSPVARSISITSQESVPELEDDAGDYKMFYDFADFNIDEENIPSEAKDIISSCVLLRSKYEGRKNDIIKCLQGYQMLASEGQKNLTALKLLNKKLRGTTHHPSYFLKNGDPVYTFGSNRDNQGQLLLQTWYPHFKDDYVALEVVPTDDPVLSMVCTALEGNVENINEMRLATIRAMIKYHKLIKVKGQVMSWGLYDQEHINLPFDYWREVSRCSQPNATLGMHARYALAIAMNIKINLLYPKVHGDADASIDYLNVTLTKDEWRNLNLREVTGIWVCHPDKKEQGDSSIDANHCALLVRNAKKLEVPPIPQQMSNKPVFKNYGFGVEEVNQVFKLFQQPNIASEVRDEIPRGPKSNCQFILKNYNQQKWDRNSNFKNHDCK